MSNQAQDTYSFHRGIIARSASPVGDEGRYRYGFDLSSNDETMDKVEAYLLNSDSEIVEQGSDTAVLRFVAGTLDSSGLYRNGYVEVVSKGVATYDLLIRRATVPNSTLDITSTDADEIPGPVNLSVDRIVRMVQELKSRTKHTPVLVKADGTSPIDDDTPLIARPSTILSADTDGNVKMQTAREVFQDNHPEVVSTKTKTYSFQIPAVGATTLTHNSGLAAPAFYSFASILGKAIPGVISKSVVGGLQRLTFLTAGAISFHLHREFHVEASTVGGGGANGHLVWFVAITRPGRESESYSRTKIISDPVTQHLQFPFDVPSDGPIPVQKDDYITTNLAWLVSDPANKTIRFRIDEPVSIPMGSNNLLDEGFFIRFTETQVGGLPTPNWEETDSDDAGYIAGKPTEVKPHGASGNKPTDLTLAEDSIGEREVREGSLPLGVLREGDADLVEGSVDASAIALNDEKTEINFPDNEGSDHKIALPLHGDAVDWATSRISNDKDSIILARKYTDSDGNAQTEQKELTLPTASDTQKGIVELATQGETDTATDDTKAVTPLKLKSNLDTTIPPARRLPALGDAGDVVTVNSAGDGLEFASPAEASVADATESVKGIAELATQAEVDAGTDTEKIVTPATLKAKLDADLPPEASEIISGTVELASTDEARNGVDDTRAMTPSKTVLAIETHQRSVATEEQAEAGTDNATVMTPLRTRQSINHNRIPTGPTLPANPHVNERFKSTGVSLFHNDYLQYGTEAPNDVTVIQYFFQGAPAPGIHSIVGYSDDPDTDAAHRNKVFLLTAGAYSMNADSQVGFYREGQPRVWHNVADTPLSDLFPHWYLIDGLSFADLSQTQTRVGINFRWRTPAELAADPNAKYNVLYPDTNVPAGDWTYAGDGQGDHGWVRTPGLGLDRAAVLELIRQNTVTEAITELIDGPGQGISHTNQGEVLNVLGLFSPAFDLDDDRNATGVLEIEADLILSGLGAVIGFGEGARSQTARIAGFTFASDLEAEAGLYDASTTPRKYGIEVGRTTLYRGTTKLGDVVLTLARNAANQVGYNLRYHAVAGVTGNQTFSIGSNIRAAFIHQQSGGGSVNLVETPLFNREVFYNGQDSAARTVATITGLTVGKRYSVYGATHSVRFSGSLVQAHYGIYNHATTFNRSTQILSQVYDLQDQANRPFETEFTATQTTVVLRRIAGSNNRVVGDGTRAETWLGVAELPTNQYNATSEAYVPPTSLTVQRTQLWQSSGSGGLAVSAGNTEHALNVPNWRDYHYLICYTDWSTSRSRSRQYPSNGFQVEALKLATGDGIEASVGRIANSITLRSDSSSLNTLRYALRQGNHVRLYYIDGVRYVP